MLETAFVFGLLSSLHCIGMCGPIALLLPVDRQNPPKRVLQLLLYHLGRFTSYTALGLLFGMLGAGIYLAGYQQQLSLACGILMVLFALIPERRWNKLSGASSVTAGLGRLKSQMSRHFKQKKAHSFYLVGLLNGLLPCGLVYVALFGALSQSHVLYSGLYMFVYGLGTLPMLSLVNYLLPNMSLKWRQRFNRFIPYFVALMGIYFILRGLGLAIPYLSPSTLSLFIQQQPHC